MSSGFGVHGRFSKIFTTHAYEEVGSVTALQVITPGIIETVYPIVTLRAFLVVSGQSIRWLVSGDDPTTSFGIPAFIEDFIEILGREDIANFKFINADGTGTAVCHISLQLEVALQ